MTPISIINKSTIISLFDFGFRSPYPTVDIVYIIKYKLSTNYLCGDKNYILY